MSFKASYGDYLLAFWGIFFVLFFVVVNYIGEEPIERYIGLHECLKTFWLIKKKFLINKFGDVINKTIHP